MSNAVTVKELVVRRGGREILHSLSCTIPEGKITGLVGPSGGGKSTLMRAIVGVQLVHSGEIEVLGSPAGAESLRHKVGYVTQSPSVYTDISIRSNVQYFASLYGKGPADVQLAIDAVGLTRNANQLTGSLSGGQFSRASLACALVTNPELMILDEPTVGLDPVLRYELWQHFENLAASGVTMLVSSHVMDEAARCSTMLLLRDGDLVAAVTPDELRKRGGSDDLDEAFLHLLQQREANA